jgi:hypothetical protein
MPALRLTRTPDDILAALVAASPARRVAIPAWSLRSGRGAPGPMHAEAESEADKRRSASHTRRPVPPRPRPVREARERARDLGARPLSSVKRRVSSVPSMSMKSAHSLGSACRLGLTSILRICCILSWIWVSNGIVGLQRSCDHVRRTARLARRAPCRSRRGRRPVCVSTWLTTGRH